MCMYAIHLISLFSMYTAPYIFPNSTQTQMSHCENDILPQS